MPLMAHLVELRSRLMKSLLVILILFLCLFYFANDLYRLLAEPLIAQLPEGSKLIATDVVSPFFIPFKLTIVTAFFLAMPFILHQIWQFISPGLYQHEKRFAIPLLATSILLFYGGMAFAYFVIFPLAFNFFAGAGPEGVSYLPDISSYLSVALKFFFAFGIAFEIPIATLLMVMSGVTTVAALKAKRPYVIVGAFVAGMLLTPPDIISQVLLAVPMWILFELGILFAGLLGKSDKNVSEVENQG